MAPLAVEPEDEAQVPLVADRDAVPAARLSDDQEVGPMPGKEMARAAGIALLPDRADDDYLRAPASGPGDRVARLVDVCSESEGLGELDEFPRRALLMTGWAVLFEEVPQDFELIHAGGPSQGRP